MSHKTSRKITCMHDGAETNACILNTAAKMFALRGFKSVVLKDISNALGIKIASLYYYYDSKDALIRTVLMRFEKEYTRYIERLTALNEKAKSLDEVMNNIFRFETWVNRNPILSFGMSMVFREQHCYAAAYKAAWELVFYNGAESIKMGLDRLVNLKVIPDIDTDKTADMLIFCLISINELYIHQFTDAQPIDCLMIQNSLHTALISSISCMPVNNKTVLHVLEQPQRILL